jgi:uncharacterized protein YndB with AHSA1/START domain
MSSNKRQSVIVADPKRDLVLERVVAVPPALVWAAWTTPEHIKKWFTPAPWSTVECEIDLRPGGIFRTVMRSPEGQEFPNLGCYLELVEGERLVWTTALGPGYRPGQGALTPKEALLFTAVITMEPAGKDGGSTRYVATVIHGDEASRNKHEAMGFHDGWGAALDQLVALMQQSHR